MVGETGSKMNWVDPFTDSETEKEDFPESLIKNENELLNSQLIWNNLLSSQKINNITKNSPKKSFNPKITLILLMAILLFLPLIVYFSHSYFDNCNLSSKELESRWSKLKMEMSSELFGQHLAVDGVLKSIYAHITDSNPSKALALCFNGWLGSGKTFLAQLVAKNLFNCGSPHVHSFIGPRHFLFDPKLLLQNQEKLSEIVEKSVRSCERSLFIFDEVDKMPSEIFKVLIPFIDHGGSVIDGVNYKKSIFIFLTNTGGERINSMVYKFISSGNRRENLTLTHFRHILAHDAFYTPSNSLVGQNKAQSSKLDGFKSILSSFYSTCSLIFKYFRMCENDLDFPKLIKKEEENGGLFMSEMISKRLIDHYIPFLPLQKSHVLLCIQREMKRRNITKINPNKIADELLYFPPNDPIFAQDGCKNIRSLVSYHVHDSDSNMFNDEF